MNLKLFVFSMVVSAVLTLLGKLAWHFWQKRPANAKKLLEGFVEIVVEDLKKKCPFNDYEVKWTELGSPCIVISPPLRMVMHAPELNETVKLPYLDRKNMYVGYDVQKKLWMVHHGTNLILQSANPDSAVDHATTLMNATFKKANKLLHAMMEGHLISRGMKVKHYAGSFSKVKPTFK